MLTKTRDQFLFRVMSDDMYSLSQVASKNGWKDVEGFWQGEMIKTPIEINGWKLIPADQYEYSIPAEAVERVLQLINSGVQIRGIVIADDARSRPVKETKPDRKPIQVKWKLVTAVLKILGTVVLAAIVAIVAVSIVVTVIAVAGTGLIIALVVGAALVYDPKLIVLISDGNGETIWISLYTWFDPPSN